MPKTIFVVDDNNTNLTMAEEALEKQYQVMTMPSAEKMFALLENVTPDLILLDIAMPEMDGFEALRLLKSNDSFAHIPVIFLTSHIDIDAEIQGFELGVIDFIVKPFSAPVLLNRIKTHLSIDDLIRERTAQLERLQNGLVHILADIVENRDKEADGHIERTAMYMKILIDGMLACGLYADEIFKWNPESLISSARLHDVGKIVIPDAILNKSSSLTLEEFETMKKHTEEGERIIDKIVSRIDAEVTFLQNAKLFAKCHHERWDGSGYPKGLKGTDIPLQGRMMAIIDVYDTLLSKRPYKKPFTEEEALSIIRDNSGKLFEPAIVAVFLELKDQLGTVKRS
jgi:putative two-component system response regulator